VLAATAAALSCRLLRLVVAMESALADGRYEEAAHLRDEYRKALQDQSREETADSTTESSTADQRKLL
jgi:protein-arginine kinase activator protein McsA